MDRITRLLLVNRILAHPLPWRIERDWTYEVIAHDGAIIAKCPNYEEAAIIVDWANNLDRELKNIDIESILNAD